MKFELKDFQETSARSIVTKLNQARDGVRGGDLEAVVLSAPTGSGKTITLAAVVDWIFGGEEGIPARPETIFLWLSDSPELNQQSKDKFLAVCDNVPYHRLVTVDSQSFNEERLSAGHVYFINTQLLGKDKLLTKTGNTKFYTFWQTIANTIAHSPEDFVLIIDEAHRGAGVSERSRKSIMQKFVTGSVEDALPPAPIVLGMSATPQRFTELLGNTPRTQRPINITPDDVRSSGLLKDLIVVTCPREATQSDLTLLEQAAARWKEFTLRWERYSIRANEKETVRPILVVQVQDGSDTKLTNSPLDDIVRVIERQTGPLGPNEIVHCFQDKQEIEYGGRIIRKIEASRIQDSPMVKVVLFKTALTTGWDCPRAEVMMSFRRALDPTSIAQLVGRMIRTPLARRIDTDDALNTVELFLPHYDYENLEAVLDRLRNPDAQEGLPSDVTSKAVSYPRDPALAEVFEHLQTLPTYSVSRAPKMSDIKRALRLTGLLTVEGIDIDADENLRQMLTDRLKTIRDKHAKSKDWQKVVASEGEIDVDVMSFAVGTLESQGTSTSRVALSDENIEQVFGNAGRLLASSEGLHRNYWKRFHDIERPNVAKLELAAIVNKPETLADLSEIARNEFERLRGIHGPSIRKQSAALKARFDRLVRASGRSEKQDWELPETIVEKPGNLTFERHLYADAKGEFSTKLNTWEEDFLKWAMAQEGFVCWFRNQPRKDWAMCLPYELAGEKPTYPDFVIVRKVSGNFVVDLVEPHDSSRQDTWAKVKGFAKFADLHYDSFGKLIVGRKLDGQMQMIDLANATIRKKALAMLSPNDLEALFDTIA